MRSKRPMEVVKQLGLEAVLKICNNNLKSVKSYFNSVCGNDCDYRYVLRELEAYMYKKYNEPDTDAKKEVLELMMEEFKNVD